MLDTPMFTDVPGSTALAVPSAPPDVIATSKPVEPPQTEEKRFMPDQLEQSIQRSITIVFWHKAKRDPVRLFLEIPTFPFFRLSEFPSLATDLSLAAGSYLDIFNDISGKWEQCQMNTWRQVRRAQTLLLRARASLLEGLAEDDCLGLSDELALQAGGGSIPPPVAQTPTMTQHPQLHQYPPQPATAVPPHPYASPPQQSGAEPILNANGSPGGSSGAVSAAGSSNSSSSGSGSRKRHHSNDLSAGGEAAPPSKVHVTAQFHPQHGHHPHHHHANAPGHAAGAPLAVPVQPHSWSQVPTSAYPPHEQSYVSPDVGEREGGSGTTGAPNGTNGAPSGDHTNGNGNGSGGAGGVAAPAADASALPKPVVPVPESALAKRPPSTEILAFQQRPPHSGYTGPGTGVGGPGVSAPVPLPHGARMESGGGVAEMGSMGMMGMGSMEGIAMGMESIGGMDGIGIVHAPVPVSPAAILLHQHQYEQQQQQQQQQQQHQQHVQHQLPQLTPLHQQLPHQHPQQQQPPQQHQHQQHPQQQQLQQLQHSIPQHQQPHPQPPHQHQIQHQAHQTLKRWPNDYTVREVFEGFRQMDVLIAQGPNVTQKVAFERVFQCRYVKSTVCRHRGLWKRTVDRLGAMGPAPMVVNAGDPASAASASAGPPPPTAALNSPLSMLMASAPTPAATTARPSTDRHLWGEFVRVVEGRAPHPHQHHHPQHAHSQHHHAHQQQAALPAALAAVPSTMVAAAPVVQAQAVAVPQTVVTAPVPQPQPQQEGQQGQQGVQGQGQGQVQQGGQPGQQPVGVAVSAPVPVPGPGMQQQQLAPLSQQQQEDGKSTSAMMGLSLMDVSTNGNGNGSGNGSVDIKSDIVGDGGRAGPGMSDEGVTRASAAVPVLEMKTEMTLADVVADVDEDVTMPDRDGMKMDGGRRKHGHGGVALPTPVGAAKPQQVYDPNLRGVTA